MSTLKLENIKHENSSTNNMVMDSDGSVSTTGNASLGGTLTVSGTTTLNNATTVNNNLTVNTDADTKIEFKDGGTNAAFITAGQGDELYVGANGTYAFRILNDGSKDTAFDNGGRVSMPNQPAFFARHLTASLVSNAYVDGWSAVTYNVGNHFVGSTGIFTAPIAGIYQLNAMIGNNYANGDGNYQIRVNNLHYNGLNFDPFSSQTTWATNVLVGQVKLSVNDTVRIYCAGNGYPDNSDWTSWSMCLIA